jgi:2-isopropylmalate synthase
VNAPAAFVRYRFEKSEDYATTCIVEVDGETRELSGNGNGRLDAISNALQSGLNLSYSNLIYKEHALEVGSGSQAISYIGITDANGTVHWGAGIDADIMTSSVKALFSAVNNMLRSAKPEAQSVSSR